MSRKSSNKPRKGAADPRSSQSAWLRITAKRRGRCSLCGRQFAVGASIRYQPTTKRVRCVGPCQRLPQAAARQLRAPRPSNSIQTRPVWRGEYISLFGHDDYWFRKCVACNRDFEQAAGRVALSKKHGICPVCEEQYSQEEIQQLKEAALEVDRERYRVECMGLAAA